MEITKNPTPLKNKVIQHSYLFFLPKLEAIMEPAINC